MKNTIALAVGIIGLLGMPSQMVSGNCVDDFPTPCDGGFWTEIIFCTTSVTIDRIYIPFLGWVDLNPPQTFQVTIPVTRSGNASPGMISEADNADSGRDDTTIKFRSCSGFVSYTDCNGLTVTAATSTALPVTVAAGSHCPPVPTGQ